MLRDSYRFSVLLGALSILSLAPAQGEAQRRRAEPQAAPLVEISPQEQAYRDAINAGLAEYAEGRFGEARALFLRAHATLPSARTLRGIGMCAFEMRDYVGAVTLLAESLTSDVRPLDDAQRTHVTALLARAVMYVGRLTLTVAPESATVLIDGAAPVMYEGVAILNPGDHEVTVEAPDLPSAVRRIHVESSGTITLHIDLTPPPMVAVPVAPPERIRPHPVTVPAAIAYGAGGVGLGLFVGFGARALSLDKSHEPECLARGTCSEASLDRQDRSAILADVGLGLMVAGTTTGLLLQLLRTEPGSEERPTVGAATDGETSMVFVQGAF